MSKKPRTVLYFAYGANTNLESMGQRCPDAEPIGRIRLRGHRLAFRGVADVVPAEAGEVWGALWRITAKCEAALDRFEGYPYHYGKQWAKFIDRKGIEDNVMFYVMNAERGEAPPPASYEACLREGYQDFNLPEKQIDAAIQMAKAGRQFHKMSAWDF
jgi:gamma-glutamylcyclotransferase (GGCT)/AIG2-like uncharacterized protein YtfP